MKIAIAKDGNMVAAHFGRCPEYAIVGVDGGRVTSRSVIQNPGHEPGFLPGYLARLGVNCIVAGGMGSRAQALFAAEGILTILGISCPVEEAVERLADETLESRDSTCERGGHDQCDGHEDR